MGENETSKITEGKQTITDKQRNQVMKLIKKDEVEDKQDTKLRKRIK